MKKLKYFSILLLCSLHCLLLSGCSFQKKEEIVWYISNPHFFHIEDAVPYEDLSSERFDLFNKRLEELDIPAKVTFRYLPDMDMSSDESDSIIDTYKKSLDFSAHLIRTLKEQDPQADIVPFSPMEYREFVALDDSLASEKNSSVLDSLPDPIWNVNSINGKTYQIPRGSMPLSDTVYSFSASFLKDYNLTLNEQEITSMTPEEVIDFLFPYFEDNRLLDKKYYLTSADDLSLGNCNYYKYLPLLRGFSDSSLAVDRENGKIVNLLTTEEMLNNLSLAQRIYREDLDIHTELQTAVPVFTIETIPTLEELTVSTAYSDRIRFSLGKRYLCPSIGNGVLNTSSNQQLAIEVLAASMYDETLSNLMIYGVPDKDYTLENGHAIYKFNQVISSVGSFSPVGNNLIAYPNEYEVTDKVLVSEKLLEDESLLLPCSNFVPDVDDTTWKQISEIAAISHEAVFTAESEEISDLNTFLKEQNQKLYDAGIESVLSGIQSQFDAQKED